MRADRVTAQRGCSGIPSTPLGKEKNHVYESNNPDCHACFELDSRQGLVTLTCGNTTELFRFDPERLPGVCCLNLWSTAGCCDVLRFVAIDREDHTIPKKGTAP